MDLANGFWYACVTRAPLALPRGTMRWVIVTSMLLYVIDYGLISARHLLDPEGTVVSLSGGEYRLLRVFLDHPQRVLSRDQLLNLTQGRDTDPLDRSIDLLVSRLRQRLKDGARESRYIKTVRNEGYVLAQKVRVLSE